MTSDTTFVEGGLLLGLGLGLTAYGWISNELSVVASAAFMTGMLCTFLAVLYRIDQKESAEVSRS